MVKFLRKLWSQEEAQDVEDAAMMAVILVPVVSKIRLVGANANLFFSVAARPIEISHRQSRRSGIPYKTRESLAPSFLLPHPC